MVLLPLSVWILTSMKFLQSYSVVRDSPNLSVNIVVFLSVSSWSFFVLVGVVRLSHSFRLEQICSHLKAL